MSKRQQGAIYVLDYEKMGKTYKPRRLHRTDCPHPDPAAQFMPATARERQTLPVCYHCAR